MADRTRPALDRHGTKHNTQHCVGHSCGNMHHVRWRVARVNLSRLHRTAAPCRLATAHTCVWKLTHQ